MVAHLYLLLGIFAYFIGYLFFGDYSRIVGLLTVWQVLSSVRYTPLFAKIYVVLLLCLAELYAMCRIAQYHMAGVARRPPGWVATGGWIWDWIAVFRVENSRNVQLTSSR